MKYTQEQVAEERICTATEFYGCDGYVLGEALTAEEAVARARASKAPFAQAIRATNEYAPGKFASCELLYER